MLIPHLTTLLILMIFGDSVTAQAILLCLYQAFTSNQSFISIIKPEPKIVM